MNPENILIEAWLMAGAQAPKQLACPDESSLAALATRQLEEDEARRLTIHLTECSDCRRYVARLAADRSVPTPTGARLSDLLAGQAISEAWRNWIRGVISYLPLDDEELGAPVVAGYDEVSPIRIDDLGRLIVELVSEQPIPAGSRVHLALVNEGARLDLCDVSVGRRGIYAVVDLSALDPRPGVLRAGVLAAEPVTVAAEPPTILSLLAAIQDDQLYGTEFWDLFAPISALGSGLAAKLAHEIAVEEGDRTTRSQRMRVGAGAATDRTPAGRVQYALNALEEYGLLWLECNGTPLGGAAESARQLRAVVSPALQTETEQTVIPVSKPMPAEDTAQVVQVQRRKETP
jgi:hypothetical protein